MSEQHGSYYVPEYSKLPFFTAFALFCLGYGSLNLVEGWFGKLIFLLGVITLIAVLFGWFRETIRESSAGLHDEQMNRSYRWGMFWFIFSDFMLFAIFYMAYFYAKYVTIPDMGGAANYQNSILGHLLLWPNFKAAWPLLVNPNPVAFPGSRGVLNPLGIPAWNTVILLISSGTLLWSKWGLLRGYRLQTMVGLVLTILLGICFVFLQSLGMLLQHTVLGLKLGSGIYGSTLYMLTSLHLANVFVGWVMLMIIMMRTARGHFSHQNRFAFDAITWFWQFVVIMWCVLFVLVYWL